MEERHLDDFSNLFDLFFAATQVVVSNIGLLLNSHHSDSRVNLRRQGEFNGHFRANVTVLLASYSHAFLNISRGQFFVKTNNELSKVFESYNIFGISGVRVKNFSASAHLERGVLLQHHLVLL